MKRIEPGRKSDLLKPIIHTGALLVITVVIGITVSCSPMQEGKELFEAKCAQCHPLEYAFRETKNLAEWNKTTETMARYSEGFISKKEAQKIAKYLANI